MVKAGPALVEVALEERVGPQRLHELELETGEAQMDEADAGVVVVAPGDEFALQRVAEQRDRLGN